MKLEIVNPSEIDATVDRGSSNNIKAFNMIFYKGRKSSNGPIIRLVSKSGEVLDTMVLRISTKGRISTQSLNEQVDPEE